MRPVLAGFWKQREARDGTYSASDLIEVNKLLDLRDREQRN
jgi:hypothetical protein